MHMRLIHLLIPCLLIGLIIPAGAFSADNLDFTIQENGDAEIRFDYTLNWIERVAVFLRIADPNAEFQSALERAYKKPVEVQSVTQGSTIFSIESLATIDETGEVIRYTVPALDFSYAEKILNEYWFAPLVQVDLSPDRTMVTFPDGKIVSYYDVSKIPATSHTIDRVVAP